MSEGDIEFIVNSTNVGYFLAGALGTVQDFSLGSSVYRHVFTRNNSNDPQFITATDDRVKDRQLFADLAVSQFTLQVGTDLVTSTATLVGNFPQTTTSGTKTTTSGNVFNFANAQFAFGTTISGAQSAANLKPHDFTLNINNNSEAVFAHGQNTPRSINHKQFEATAEFSLYFENTTDRDAYYNQSKQAASFELYGAGIGGGFTESLIFNLYQTSVKTFTVETGLNDFFAEKVSLICEYENATGRTIDATLTNTKVSY